eukprot:TRINITY_DN1922_c0_g2_i2.p2 TRINITY_DN1922_c0_g2~~TRINITY_DN1922_c0_g2_i2.p2  ORF type:complete len:187 (+),score=39.36 TRINITY_DN1922_c0_g2_i2:888-1448(+)
MCVFAFSFSIVDLVLIAQGINDASGFSAFLQAVKKQPVALIIVLMTFFFVWSLLGLWGFHCYLTGTNQTTNEEIKRSFTNETNPWTRGCCSNLTSTVCGPKQPKQVQFRQLVSVEDVEQGRALTSVTPAAPLRARDDFESTGYQTRASKKKDKSGYSPASRKDSDSIEDSTTTSSPAESSTSPSST